MCMYGTPLLCGYTAVVIITGGPSLGHTKSICSFSGYYSKIANGLRQW